MKKKDSKEAIECDSDSGPIFGNDDYYDIYINEKDICFIDNDGGNGYECHPKYKSSLFINSAGPYEVNYFNLLDYEVYSITNECSCCMCF